MAGIHKKNKKDFVKEIFRAYDVRGLYPKTINEAVISGIATALGQKFNRGKFLVGYDARRSSKILAASAIKSLKKIAKAKVIGIGLATTPMFYFFVSHLRAVGGMMITASHDPKNFNGLKAVGKRASPISGVDIYKYLTPDK